MTAVACQFGFSLFQMSPLKLALNFPVKRSMKFVCLQSPNSNPLNHPSSIARKNSSGYYCCRYQMPEIIVRFGIVVLIDNITDAIATQLVCKSCL